MSKQVAQMKPNKRTLVKPAKADKQKRTIRRISFFKLFVNPNQNDC